MYGHNRSNTPSSRNLGSVHGCHPTVVTVCVLLLMGVTLVSAQENPLPRGLLESLGQATRGITSDTIVHAVYCGEDAAVTGLYLNVDEASEAVDRGPGPCGMVSIATQRTQETGVIPSRMLMRIAEATDGHRSGDTVWVVASDTFPHNVGGVFDNLEDALDSLAQLGPGFSVFGPVETHRDLIRDRPFIIEYHDPDSYCPPWDAFCGELRLLEFLIPWESVQSIRVVVEGEGRTLFEQAFAPDDIDALFFSLAAFDKFYAPYLTKVYGAEFAATARQELMNWITELPPLPPR